MNKMIHYARYGILALLICNSTVVMPMKENWKIIVAGGVAIVGASLGCYCLYQYWQNSVVCQGYQDIQLDVAAVAGEVVKVEDQVQKFNADIKTLEQGFGGISHQSQQLKNSINENYDFQKEQIGQLNSTSNTARQKSTQQSEGIGQVTETTNQLNVGFEDIKKSFCEQNEQVSKEMDNLTQSASNVSKGVAESSKNIVKLNDQHKEITKNLNSLYQEYDKTKQGLDKVLKNLNTLKEKSAIEDQGQIKNIELLKKELENKFEVFDQQLGEYEKNMPNIFHAVEDALDNDQKSNIVFANLQQKMQEVKDLNKRMQIQVDQLKQREDKQRCNLENVQLFVNQVETLSISVSNFTQAIEETNTSFRNKTTKCCNMMEGVRTNVLSTLENEKEKIMVSLYKMQQNKIAGYTDSFSPTQKDKQLVYQS